VPRAARSRRGRADRAPGRADGDARRAVVRARARAGGVVPRALARARARMARGVTREHALLPGDRVRAGGVELRRSRGGPLPSLARTAVDRDARGLRRLPRLALRPARPPWR